HPADVTRRLRQKTSISNAYAVSPMPGDVDSLGPDTFKVLIGFVRSHCWMFSDTVPFSKSQTSSGRVYRPTHSTVHIVPASEIVGQPLRLPSFDMMTSVPSESRTFHSVRWDRGTSGASAVRSLGVSCSGNSAGITPDSHARPGGHHPPISNPQSFPARSAA